MRPMFLVVPLLLLLAGCGARPSPAGAPDQTAPEVLRGRTFIATAVTADGKPYPLVADTEVSFEFTDDGRLIVRPGCNMLQGTVDTAGGKLVVDGGLSQTDMGCDQARMDQDSFVGEVLAASPSWELTGDRLTIRSGSTTFDLVPREAVRPDKELVGTTWVLDTLVDGEVASSMTAGAPEVTLVFDGKRVVADTHCNGVSTEYTMVDGRIVFEPGAMTRMACEPEIMRGETAVYDVLSGEATYELTDSRLSLTSSSGKGIQLHAK
jgi:heat shock protein HslJ